MNKEEIETFSELRRTSKTSSCCELSYDLYGPSLHHFKMSQDCVYIKFCVGFGELAEKASLVAETTLQTHFIYYACWRQ